MAAAYVGRSAVNIFYQESTRTRISFELAEVAWGMSYSSTENARAFSSASKGESLEHTIQVINGYNPDIIVLRHDKTGGAKRAANVSRVPIINAGDGGGEHPTQAYLDTFTIWEHLSRLDNFTLTFMGDLKYGRTVRSLVHVLTKGNNNHFNFVSVPELSLSDDIKAILDASGNTYDEYFDAKSLRGLLPETDILYVTRSQTNLGAPKKIKDAKKFRVTQNSARLLPSHAGIMHPMPINEEITRAVDQHPRAIYFKQAGNGLYVRMALIEQILEGKLKL